jgi:hypothetical protein
MTRGAAAPSQSKRDNAGPAADIKYPLSLRNSREIQEGIGQADAPSAHEMLVEIWVGG